MERLLLGDLSHPQEAVKQKKIKTKFEMQNVSWLALIQGEQLIKVRPFLFHLFHILWYKALLSGDYKWRHS